MHPARKRRLELKLTQAELARRTGIPRNRINDYEAGRRFLSADALAKLKQELQLHLLVSPDTCLSDGELARYSTVFPWQVHVDPGMTWASIPAKYAKYYSELKLHRRPPVEFRSMVRCDSALEALACDYLFENGATPLFSNPVALGFSEYPLLDSQGKGYGLQLRASFRILRPQRELLWWPQVTFFANGLVQRADALLLDASNRQWVLLEIDGDGHINRTWDEERDAALSLPIMRFGSPVILNFMLLEMMDLHFKTLQTAPPTADHQAS